MGEPHDRGDPVHERRAERAPWLTYALIAANVAMFGVEIALGAHPLNPTPQQLIDAGGELPNRTLTGEWWRLGAAMFLHGGVLHLLVNMVCLYQGRIVERIFGKPGFTAIYLSAGLLGGVVSLLVRSPYVVSVGASGAVFGVYGAFGAFLWLRRSMIEETAWKNASRGMAGFVALNLLFGATVSGINLTAHIGGLVAGFVAGAALLVRENAGGRRIVRSLVIAVASVALTVGVVISKPPPADLDGLLTSIQALERDAGAEVAALLQRVDKGEISDVDAAASIERDLLVRWQGARDRARAVDPPARLAALWAALDRYLGARVDELIALQRLLQATDPEQRSTLEATFRATTERTAQLAAQVEAETARLGSP
ncbi:MAG: rhomboid family intramembrane serine protease [Kofleriaceae bacterium]